MSRNYLLACILAALSGSSVQAQTSSGTDEVLTTETVLSLAAAGIPDEALVAKIKASKGMYDTSTANILTLKQKGLSGPVIAAMIGAADIASKPAMSMDAADPMIPHPAGVYFVSPEPDHKMVVMQPTVSSQAKTGGIFGYALTGGLASMSIKAAIPGSAAALSTSKQPTFYFFFDDSNPGTAAQTSAWLAGSASVVKSPSEFSLVQLMEKKGRREARVGSANIAGAKTGIMDKDRIEFNYEQVRQGVFKVTPKQPLEAGQYGFVYSVAGAAGGALTARVYDFGVK